MSDDDPRRAMWEERYGGEEYAFGTQPNDFLRSVAWMLPPGGDVVCLAEGEGRNAVWLAGQGHAVTMLERSAAGVRKAVRLARERGVPLRAEVADLAVTDLGVGRWDGVVSVFAHLPPDLRRAVHRGAVTALRPGGAFILEAYRPEQIGRGTGGPPTIAPLADSATLATELAGLTVVWRADAEREVQEGRFHGGWSATAQIVAVKPG